MFQEMYIEIILCLFMVTEQEPMQDQLYDLYSYIIVLKYSSIITFLCAIFICMLIGKNNALHKKTVH